MKRRVLFLCTHNSARSQMAEAWLRALAGDRYEVASAGTVRTHVRREAVAVMREAGIDMSAHASKALDAFVHDEWDCVITVCDSANESCPVFPRARARDHWSVADPSAVEGEEDARYDAFRAARDDVRARIERWLADEERPRVLSDTAT